MALIPRYQVNQLRRAILRNIFAFATPKPVSLYSPECPVTISAAGAAFGTTTGGTIARGSALIANQTGMVVHAMPGSASLPTTTPASAADLTINGFVFNGANLVAADRVLINGSWVQHYTSPVVTQGGDAPGLSVAFTTNTRFLGVLAHGDGSTATTVNAFVVGSDNSQKQLVTVPTVKVPGVSQVVYFDLGSSATRNIVVYVSNYLGAVLVDSGATFQPFDYRLPSGTYLGSPTIAIATDSYGSSARTGPSSAGAEGFCHEIARALGAYGHIWTPRSGESYHQFSLNAIPGQYAGPLTAAGPDILLCALGINVDDSAAEVVDTFSKLRASSPGAILVVIGPWAPGSYNTQAWNAASGSGGAPYLDNNTFDKNVKISKALAAMGGAWVYIDTRYSTWTSSGGATGNIAGVPSAGKGFVLGSSSSPSSLIYPDLTQGTGVGGTANGNANQYILDGTHPGRVFTFQAAAASAIGATTITVGAALDPNGSSRQYDHLVPLGALAIHSAAAGAAPSWTNAQLATAISAAAATGTGSAITQVLTLSAPLTAAVAVGDLVIPNTTTGVDYLAACFVRGIIAGLSALESTSITLPAKTGAPTLGAITSSSISVTLPSAPTAGTYAVASCNVFRNGKLIANKAFAATFSDTGLTPSTSYVYSCQAVDGQGNVGQTGTGVVGITSAVSAGSGSWAVEEGVLTFNAGNAAGYWTFLRWDISQANTDGSYYSAKKTHRVSIGTTAGGSDVLAPTDLSTQQIKYQTMIKVRGLAGAGPYYFTVTSIPYIGAESTGATSSAFTPFAPLPAVDGSWYSITQAMLPLTIDAAFVAANGAKISVNAGLTVPNGQLYGITINYTGALLQLNGGGLTYKGPTDGATVLQNGIRLQATPRLLELNGIAFVGGNVTTCEGHAITTEGAAVTAGSSLVYVHGCTETLRPQGVGNNGGRCCFVAGGVDTNYSTDLGGVVVVGNIVTVRDPVSTALKCALVGNATKWAAIGNVVNLVSTNNQYQFAFSNTPGNDYTNLGNNTYNISPSSCDHCQFNYAYSDADVDHFQHLAENTINVLGPVKADTRIIHYDGGGKCSVMGTVINLASGGNVLTSGDKLRCISFRNGARYSMAAYNVVNGNGFVGSIGFRIGSYSNTTGPAADYPGYIYMFANQEYDCGIGFEMYEGVTYACELFDNFWSNANSGTCFATSSVSTSNGRLFNIDNDQCIGASKANLNLGAGGNVTVYKAFALADNTSGVNTGITISSSGLAYKASLSGLTPTPPTNLRAL
jgi:hypothetical protein